MEIVIQLWHQNFISILFTHKTGEVKTKLADLIEAQRTTKPVCLSLLDEKGKLVGSVLVEVSETKDVDAGNLALEQAHKAVTEAGLEHAPDVPSDDTMDRLTRSDRSFAATPPLSHTEARYYVIKFVQVAGRRNGTYWRLWESSN